MLTWEVPVNMQNHLYMMPRPHFRGMHDKFQKLKAMHDPELQTYAHAHK